jgi:hypothetical protein
MKKLLMLALSAILVLGMAVIAMAAPAAPAVPAVTLNGEIDGVADTTHSTSTGGGQVTVNAAINNNVSFQSEFTFGGFEKGYNSTGVNSEGTVYDINNKDLNATEMGPMDHYFVNANTAIGSFKTGWVDNWTGQKLDQIGTQIYDQGKHSGANFIYSNKVAENASVSLGYEPQTGDSAVLVDYAKEKYGVEFAYSQPGSQKLVAISTVDGSTTTDPAGTKVNGFGKTDPSYGFNGYYNVAPGAVVYGQYAIKSAASILNPKEDALLAVGAKYNTGAGFWGEAEYGQLSSSKNDTMVEAGYYIQPNATIYVRNRDTNSVSTNYAIMAISF